MGNNMTMDAEAGPPEISSYRYHKIIQEITLLRSMQEIDNKEVKRLIGMLNSTDPENWTVAEEFVKNKLSNE
jgi:hypothetical protein